MKTKIQEMLNDYYEDVKKIFHKLRKNIKKVSRKIRYSWNNPKTKFGFYFTGIIKSVGITLRDSYRVFKETLLKSENRKRNLTTIGVFLFVYLFLLIISPSYAVYLDRYEFSVLGSKVGDKYSKYYDYTLHVYIEDINNSGEGSGNYNLTSDIPVSGYSYSGYNCKNGSTLIYDESTQNTSVSLDQKDVCSIYFDLINTSDIVVKVMLEDSVDSNTYTLSNTIPYFGYKYSHYECDNNSILTYNSELHNVSVSSDKQEYCQIYFQKESVDVEVKLYVENTYGSKDYIEKVSIPANNTYVLNEEETYCLNNFDERIDSTVSYIDGYIEVSTSEVAYCKVYLDKTNE